MLPRNLIEYYKLCNIKDKSMTHPAIKVDPIKLRGLSLGKYFQNNKTTQKVTGGGNECNKIIVM